MSEFRPKLEDITLFTSLSVSELNELPRDIPGYKQIKKFPDTCRLGLAQLRAALRVFQKMGAIKPGWLAKQDMLVERVETSPDVDEALREALAPYVGENGDAEDLVQTLERILEERGNVKRNRERR